MVVVQPRPGFKNRISDALGVVVGVVIMASAAAFAIWKAFQFLWPTLKWLVPLLAFVTLLLFMAYKIYRMPDNQARQAHQYKATVLLISTLLILFCLLTDVRSVVQ